MSEKKGWGKAVMGWFVVQDDDGTSPENGGEMTPGELSADELIAKYAAADEPDPPPPPPPPIELSGPLPSVDPTTMSIDFQQVYESAGIAQEARDRVDKALQLLGSLPADTPAATKKQIVEASLAAFGVPTQEIIEGAVSEMEALESFIRVGQAQTQNLIGEAQQRIGALEQEILHLRQTMQGAVDEQNGRARAANMQKLEVQKVLEFFGQDAVAAVVRESPRLHEPPSE